MQGEGEMMRLYPALFPVFILFLVYSHPLYSHGVGFYTTGNAGGGASSNSWSGFGSTRLGINYSIGCGFVYDSAVASNDTFNYRLNAGYENNVASGSPFFTDKSMHRVTLSNTFGFALFKNKYVRVWMGPQVELACRFAERTYFTNAGSIIGLVYTGTRGHMQYAAGELGIGCVLGINIHTGDLFTLGFEFGFNGNAGIGRSETSQYGVTIITMPPFPPDISKDIPRIESKVLYILKVDALARINFIFRIGESEKKHSYD
jgi:hypothetical protein